MASEEKTAWDIPGIGKLVSGIKVQLMKVNLNDTVVHVQFPSGTPRERSEQFARALRKEFPPRVRMAFTTPGVKIDVSRPKEVALRISNCRMSREEIHKQIDRALAEPADKVEIVLSDIEWTDA
jgi:hypothetical protein